MSSNSLNHNVHGQELNPNKFIKIFLYCVFTLAAAILVYLFVVLLITFTLKDPQFTLKEARTNNLKLLTTASSINSTIISTNPNKIIRIHYDDLVLYASYKGETITTGAFIDIVYGETKPVTVSLLVDQRLVAPYLADRLQQDQENGKLELEFNVMGYLRFEMGKFWAWERSRFTVKCPTVLKVEPKTPLSFTTQGTVECSMK